MNSRMQEAKQSCAEHAGSLLHSAEKELAAFSQAVLELFGSEQARLSAEDWIEELELMDLPAGAGSPDWRRLTISAASRLALRVQHSRFKNASRIHNPYLSSVITDGPEGRVQRQCDGQSVAVGAAKTHNDLPGKHFSPSNRQTKYVEGVLSCR